MASDNVNTQSQVGFIGFVTRKDKDTGVTLRAKIVTPNKKLATVKDFRVKVKANALDDYSCCVIDHATMKKIIENTQDLESLSESFQFLYNGEHGTTISYSIQGKGDDDSIKNYLSDDGTLAGRPKYSSNGSSDASGLIVLTVKKGDAKVESRIMVTVKGMSADEVLNSDKIYNKTSGSLEAYLWDNIKGKNKGYSAKGYQAIGDKLEFNNTKEIIVAELSDTPITCTWTVVNDEIGSFMKNNDAKFPDIFQDPDTKAGMRICMDSSDPNYGCIYRPPYKTCIDELVGSGYAELMASATGNDARDRCFRIGLTDPGAGKGRLELKCTMRLGDATLERSYFCATKSKFMTNSELMTYIKEIMRFKLDCSDSGSGGTLCAFDNNAIKIIVPDMNTAAGGATKRTIAVYGNGYYSTIGEVQRLPLMLGPNTLNGIVSFTIAPAVVKATDNGGGNFTMDENTPYEVEALFSNMDFDVVNKSDGAEADDMYRLLTIPVGTKASNNGLWMADNILDNNTTNKAFGITFQIEIPALSTDDKDSVIGEFRKIFYLARQGS